MALFAFTVWLLFFTPLVRWCLSACLYGGLAYLAVQLATLPHKHVTFAASGGRAVQVLPEELLAKVDVTFTTEIGRGQGSEQFALSVTGTITNNSDRVIESVRMWCRVEKLSLGDSEIVGNWINLVVRPGETRPFAGPVSSYLRGVIKAGYSGLQAPKRHFCRLDEIYAMHRS